MGQSCQRHPFRKTRGAHETLAATVAVEGAQEHMLKNGCASLGSTVVDRSFFLPKHVSVGTYQYIVYILFPTQTRKDTTRDRSHPNAQEDEAGWSIANPEERYGSYISLCNGRF